MFTVETDFDLTKVTIMDESDQVDDFILRFAEEGIYLSQFDESRNRDKTIYLTTKMFNDMLIALNSKDGTFITR